MEIVKNKEEDKSEIISFAIADNCLSGPEECILHVLTELRKAGHTVRIFTENMHKPDWVQDLLVFLPKVGYDGLLFDRLQVSEPNATDMFLDERNLGGFPGWYSFYGSLLAGPVIATTQRNITLAKDYNFWTTGKEGSPITGQPVPKIILPGQIN